jgi:uncharacterized protein YndB with AHSA1/START domain
MMRNSVTRTLAVLLLSSWGASSAAEDRSRSIVLNVVVEAPADRVYELWTSREGANQFFGVDALIERRVGGLYEIYFLPRTHPDSDANSTKGHRVLGLDPGRALSFEWGYPPFAAELRPNGPTRVDVSFEPLRGQPLRTHVCLEHSGFGRGGSWDKLYEFFVRGWSDILFRLERSQPPR